MITTEALEIFKAVKDLLALSDEELDYIDYTTEQEFWERYAPTDRV
jgi:hypothetical protein